MSTKLTIDQELSQVQLIAESTPPSAQQCFHRIINVINTGHDSDTHQIMC